MDTGRAKLKAARAAPAEQERAQDLLRGVGRRTDRVGTEDGQRLALGQALAEFLLGRQRSAKDDAADPGEQPLAGVVGMLAASLAVISLGPV
ncbi:MAG: hypothetical protein WKF78_09435 [Candidatus Limnocylindrales bacterium]